MKIEDGWQELYIIKCYGSSPETPNWNVFRRERDSWANEPEFAGWFWNKQGAERYIKQSWIRHINASFEKEILNVE